MNIEFVGRHYDIDDRTRQFTEEKLDKVMKFLEEPVEIRVTLSEEKNRHTADLHVHHKLGILQAAEEAHGMWDAVQSAVEKVEKQARRSRKKLTGKKRRAAKNGDLPAAWPMDVLERESVSGGNEPRIVKSSNLEIKPMSLEEAALQLDNSKNDFLVFRDATSDRVSVLYKRRDANYGLIVPEA
ncbi:MAG TPA: ribosome-associated translation inhibitor RaiA [Thermoanaerobaculia bacterium]|nr:ribosome-associated translation inhibitor RaiA [Thermoanaerobaculia bacterium]